MTEITSGAEAQLRMVADATRSAAEMAQAVDASADAAQQSADAAREAREPVREGVDAVLRASTAMNAVRDSSRSASEAMSGLEGKSSQIGCDRPAHRRDRRADQPAGAQRRDRGRPRGRERQGLRRRGRGGPARWPRTPAARRARSRAWIAEIQSETRAVVAIVADGATRTEEGTGTVEGHP